MLSPLNPGQRGGGRLLLAMATLLGLVGRAQQQRDPIKDFCRRWGHQTAVVDDKLYIDGGSLTWGSTKQFPGNYTNPYFIYHDLKNVSDTGMPPPNASLSKNSSIPSVSGGALWADDVNKRIYLYGGESNDGNPWPLALYAYDILNNIWNIIDVPGSSQAQGLSYGAGLSIPNRGEAYYYGGWMNNRTDPGWGNKPAQASSFLLQYDMDANTWKNRGGPDDRGRAEGVMVYLPAGDGGMMVYIGGVRAQLNGTWEAQPMKEIILFDVLSGKSYFQEATGRIPDSRRRFCAGATWADDRSSYNIYLYGGLGEEEGSLGFDDVYILSIPSFVWIRMYPPTTNGTGDYPHHSMSCNVVNSAQMIIHGGYFPGLDICDTDGQWGLHNLDMGRQNKDNLPWALYDPSKTRYVVPTDVLSVVGGQPTGGATKTAPDEGFMSRDLGTLLTRTASVAERTPTRPVSSPDAGSRGLSGGAIAGIAVGAAAVALALAMACFCVVRRHRRRNRGNADKTTTALPQSVPASGQHPGYPHSDPLILGHPQSPSSHTMSMAMTSPSQSIHRPQTVPPYGGPPVELPSAEGCEGQLYMYRGGSRSPGSETAMPVALKYDAQGNVWQPQVSIMQGPVVSAPSPSGNSFGSLSPAKPRSEYLYGPVRSPRDVECEMTRGQQQQYPEDQDQRPSQQQPSRNHPHAFHD